jgi:glycosyltransferase involved in cell wall biosynthesis
VKRYASRKLGDAAIFLGTRNDVAELYADFDVAVHPSRSENLGAAGESLLLAVPTISTTVGGFPDLVRDGETGWTVPPKSPELLAAAILEALTRPGVARALAEEGQRHARMLLAPEVNTMAVILAYQDALEQGDSVSPKR